MSSNFKKPFSTPNLNIFETSEDASIYVAHLIAALIRERQKQGQHAVLGLATGTTPKIVYQELIRMHNIEGLSFSNVISFNLDEYYPIPSNDERSFSYFMHNHLFQHVDIAPHNIHIPNFNCSNADIINHCVDYDQKIIKAGGIDIQLLGIGRNGHIGFNEPGSDFDSVTRLVDLDMATKEDALRDFISLEEVPSHAISIGIHNISRAKKIILLALGERKSKIIKTALQGEVTTMLPASVLQDLSQVEFVLDKEAGMLLG